MGWEVAIFVAGFLLMSRAQSPDNESSKAEMEMTQSLILDKDGAFVLLWTPLEKEIIFEIQAKTLGYVGLGISPNGEMEGSDIMMGYVDDSGTAQVTDKFVPNGKTAVMDNIQDFQLVRGFKNETHTTLRFSRPYLTCDEDNDLPIKKGTTRVIWAYHPEVPESPEEISAYHGPNRGVQSLLLKELDTTKQPKGTLEWEIRLPNVSLPDDIDTLYWCNIFKAPDMDKKHHIISYSPIIEPENKAYVHHMIIYECSLEDEVYEKWVGHKGAQCYSKKMPLSWFSCARNFLMGWAVGTSDIVFPEELGLPILRKYGGSSYFMLEIHYDNPSLKSGIVDNSGFRMILTENLREYEGGILTVGSKTSPMLLIPPHYVHESPSLCSAGCTEKHFPNTGIQIFGSIPHAHLIGSEITVQHIRDGQELAPLVTDTSYDFNYQRFRVNSPTVTVLPNDSLITTCIYDSSDRDGPTFGGLSTKNEMCIVFLFYYPRLPISNCVSFVPPKEFFEGLGIRDEPEGFDYFMETQLLLDFNKESIKRSEAFALKNMKNLNQAGENVEQDENFLKRLIMPNSLGKSVYDYLTKDVSWDDKKFVKNFRDVTSSKYYPYCPLRGTNLTSKEMPVDYPTYIPYVEPPIECVAGTSMK